jgi:F-type H+-transporting ATPase subunit alpha
MADLLREIEAQIAGAKTTAGRENVGVIREIGDGVARIEGLTDAMLNEMIDLGQGCTGLALNLEEAEVGVIILGDYTKLREETKSARPENSCRCRSARDCWDAS